jgi:transcriptional regulator with XRE-family HTH domain
MSTNKSNGREKTLPYVPQRNVSRGTIIQQIGERFLLRRTALKMKKTDVAEKSGVSTVTIGKLEKGELENVSLEILDKIAGALKLEIDSIEFINLE